MGYIRVKPASPFVDVLHELSGLPDAPSNVKAYSKKLLEEAIVLQTSDIKWCHNRIKERGIPHRIHTLLNESEIILPKYEPTPRNPELEARIQKLKAEQGNREYRELTKNLYADEYDGSSFGSIGKELHEMNRQLVTGLQYLVSVVGTFCAIFIGLSLAFDDYGPRVLVAVFCALIVAVAEIYFIIKQDILEEGKIKNN